MVTAQSFSLRRTGMHTMQVHVHISYADICGAEECATAIQDSFIQLHVHQLPPFSIHKLNYIPLSCVMHDIPCALVHSFLFLEFFLSNLKDCQSSATFRKPFLINPTGISSSPSFM